MLGIAKGTDRTRNQIRKQIESIFKSEGLRITTEINMIETDFLDVILNLETYKHRPFRKPGDNPTYIHVLSNHPPTILKQGPKTVEKRISRLCSDKETLDREILPYQKAIEISGHKVKMKYCPETQIQPRK